MPPGAFAQSLAGALDLVAAIWQAWSALPPPHPLQLLKEQLYQGVPLYLYATF